ncbi:11S globulin subunit beta-like [Bidens hawaiensis]|uniref:11S globulin subunit beta-like n=1 Tax=Bidens hawaiensis TaxID=980011 RepID=UPI00404B5156
MRSTCFPPGLICFLLLFSVTLAQQSSRVRGPSDCQFRTITAREPNRRQVSEAGFSEFWDSNEKDELECAGVQVVRHTINPKGLLLPYYPNTPELVFVVQGQGIQGIVLPGCENTFETTFRSEDGSEQVSKHQKVYRYKEGDVLALPAGVVHWTYNDGDTPIVIVALRDTSNVANQLDREFRKFFLAGNPQSQVQQGEPWGTEELPVFQDLHRGPPYGGGRGCGGRPPYGRPPYGRPPYGGGWGRPPYGGGWGGRNEKSQELGTEELPVFQDLHGRPPYGGGRGCGGRPTYGRPPYWGGPPYWGRPPYGGGWGGRNDKPLQTDRPMEPQQEQEGFNMFAGFTDDILSEVFGGIEYEIVSRLKGLNDNRGLIVLAENFKVVIPEQQSGAANNLAEQTICSTQLSASISNPDSADVFNPSGGRVTNLNSNKLPILKSFQLNAERGVLYKNAVLAPHFNLNAHSIMYIISGSARIQIVRSEGVAAFDEAVKTGQLIVVPQSFPVIMKAGEEGCEWVAFKTNDNAITAQLAGRFSYIWSLPDEILANAYNISPEQAKSLKYNRKEGVILSPRSRSGSLIKEAKNVVLNAVFG